MHTGRCSKQRSKQIHGKQSKRRPCLREDVCAYLNMPKPMTEKNCHNLFNKITESAKVVVDVSMKSAVAQCVNEDGFY